MHYRVIGTDEGTGNPRELLVDAESAGEAIDQARGQAVRVRSVTEMTEKDATPHCLRCGSAKVIPRVWVLDRDEGFDENLSVRIYSNPHAMIFTGREDVELCARICGECGACGVVCQQSCRSLVRLRGPWQGVSIRASASGIAMACTSASRSPLVLCQVDLDEFQ